MTDIHISPATLDEVPEFIQNMRKAIDEKQPHIINVELDDFLEALAAVFVDHRGILLPEENTGKIDVAAFCDMLSTALIYE